MGMDCFNQMERSKPQALDSLTIEKGGQIKNIKVLSNIKQEGL